MVWDGEMEAVSGVASHTIDYWCKEADVASSTTESRRAETDARFPPDLNQPMCGLTQFCRVLGGP